MDKQKQVINEILADIMKDLKEKGEVDHDTLARMASHLTTKISMIPDAHTLTKSYLRRCEWEAREDEEKYRCFICDKKYNTELDMAKHLETHMLDYLGGVPMKISQARLEKMLDGLPEQYHNKIKKMFRVRGDG